MAHRKQKTPAQMQRHEVSAAVRARGERGTNIWLVRPPFETRDLVLNSDLQFEAFHLIEGEPTFELIRYLPQWYEALEDKRASGSSKVFAVVTTVAQQEFSVRLAFEADPITTGSALTPSDGVIRIHAGVLDSHLQRVENWRRIIPCIRRLRLHAVAAIGRQLAPFVHTQGRTNLRDLRGRFSDVDAGTFFGTVAILLRRRELHSDLDTRPWSLNTRVWSETP